MLGKLHKIQSESARKYVCVGDCALRAGTSSDCMLPPLQLQLLSTCTPGPAYDPPMPLEGSPVMQRKSSVLRYRVVLVLQQVR